MGSRIARWIAVALLVPSVAFAAASALPNLGIQSGISLGETGWDTADKLNHHRLDALVQAGVKSRTTTAEPGAPTNGDRYIVPSGATGTNWGSIAAGTIVEYVSGSASWYQYAPKKGWRTWVDDRHSYYAYDGSAWFEDLTFVNVKAWGAKGDGSTNDRVAIQQAINSLPATGGTVYFPAGEYVVTAAVKVPHDGIDLVGSGKQTSIIHNTATSTDIIQLFGSNCSVSHLCIQGPGASGAGIGIVGTGLDSTGAVIANFHDNKIADCLVTGTASWGINIHSAVGGEAFSWFIVDCTVVSANSGGSLRWGGTSSAPSLICRGSTFDGLALAAARSTYGTGSMQQGGVHIDNATGVTFDQCIFEPSNMVAVSILTPNAVWFNHCLFSMFNAAATTAASGDGSYPFITTSGFGGGINITSCWFKRYANNKGPRVIRTDNNASSGGIVNNTISGCTIGAPNEPAVSKDDIFLGSGMDEIAAFGNLVSGFGGDRSLGIQDSVTISERQTVPKSGLSFSQGTYNKGHLVLGTRHLWKEDATGRFRSWDSIDTTGSAQSSPPTADNNGEWIVTTKTRTAITGATPAVGGNTFFTLTQSGATNVTSFTGGENGQVIQILFLDGNSTIKVGTGMRVHGAADFNPQTNDVLSLIYFGGTWYEICYASNH